MMKAILFLQLHREQISNRATDNTQSESGNSWRQLFLFPEGTCTNGKAIVKFKTGAFQAVMLAPHKIRSL